MNQFWNERYGQTAYAYGEKPNVFFSEQLAQIPVGKALFPAEGEGRNAVYAAKLGWDVTAFDMSDQGKMKAEQLAEKNGVSIDYQVSSAESFHAEPESFDLLALIYAHFPGNSRVENHKRLAQLVKPGGMIILEGFSKENLKLATENTGIGGPKDINMLFSVEEIKADFSDFEVILAEEQQIQLKEGLYHNGTGSVIRFVGKKK